jgi:hypothetical protein
MPRPPYRSFTAFEPSPPPFDFDDVCSRVFPLPASARRLQRFCDQHLNVAPEFSYCRPFVPYVFLVILSYGRMGGRSAGWVSQNEVIFTLALEWRHWSDDGEERVDIASVSPYIFVDDGLSLTTGREVYGWPKIRAWFEPDIESWARDVVVRPRPIRMKTQVFPRPYEGLRPRRRTLLEIDVEPREGITDLPPNLRFLWQPLANVRRGLEGAFKLVRDWTELILLYSGRPPALGPPRLPIPDTVITRILGRLGEDPADPSPGLDAGRDPDLAFTTLNLKQFPDPSAPPESRQACYQALVRAPMSIARLKRGGLLGDLPVLAGDTSGSFTVRLHQYPEFPILESLGLQTESREEHPDALEEVVRGVTRGPGGGHILEPFRDSLSDAPSVSIATLKPLFPYWLDADLGYGRGETVCWRTDSTDWSTGEEPGAPTDEPLPYNTANGDIVVPLQGPFRFHNVTLRVLVLKADGEALQHLVDRHFNDVQNVLDLEPAVDRVFLATATYQDTESEGNDVGWWADREVGFWLLLKPRGSEAIPKPSADQQDEPPDIYGTAPFLFGNSQFAALTLRETYGLPILHAEIESPDDTWMDHRGPVADRPSLRLTTPIFPATTANQQARERTLLEIISSPETDDEALEPENIPRPEWWSVLEAVADGKLVNTWQSQSIFIRRFRDATEPDAACFQSLLLGTISINCIEPRLLDPRNLEVRIHRHPSHPLVSALGLEVERTERRPNSRAGRAWEGRPVDIVRPELAFWLEVHLETGYKDQEMHLYPPPPEAHEQNREVHDTDGEPDEP